MNSTAPDPPTPWKPEQLVDLNLFLSRLPRFGGRIGLGYLASACVFAIWVIALASGPILAVLLFAGCFVFPYIPPWIASIQMTETGARLTLTISLVLMVLSSLFAIVVSDDGAQAGIVLIIVPVVQLMGLFFAILLAVALEINGKTRSAL